MLAGRAVAYRHKPHQANWVAVNEFIPMIETPTQFGGRRRWFQCLRCSRRCRVLHGGAYFRCRRCNGLRYDTQYEPAFARAATRALTIRERLGGRSGIYDPFPEKPKGMQWKTYGAAAGARGTAAGRLGTRDHGEVRRESGR